MSERKSWDVQPQRRPAAQAPEPKRTSAPAPVRKRAPTPERVTIQRPQRTPVKPSQPGALKQRRKQKRKVMRYVFLAILFALFAAGMCLLWTPTFRVTSVSAQGPGAELSKQVVLKETSGTYWYLIPRNSVFFMPKEAIRQAVLNSNPEASAVSLTRTSFSAIEVVATPRAKSFVWCGTAIDTPNPDGLCYQTDIEGLIFKPDDVAVGSTTATTSKQELQGQVRIFAPLDRDISDGSSPVHARLIHPERIPDALKFVDTIRELGAPVTSLAIRGDEADLWIGGPTRITYVLGSEVDAALLAASTLPSISLKDGTVKYADLRFPGKAYIGRYGE